MTKQKGSLRLERQQKDATLKRLALGTGVGLGAGLGASTAMAASVVDMSPIVTDVNDTKPEMVNVGTAMLGLVVIAALFLMVRRVLR